MADLDNPAGQPASFFQTQNKSNVFNEKYQFLNDSYDGTGGYVTGAYLIPHTREEEMRYNRRVLSMYYLNYIRPIVNSHVNPIWRVEPTREFNPDQITEEFINDVDGRGHDINSFMKRSGHFAKLHGKTFIVVDNFSDVPDNLAAVVEERKFPYSILVTADRVRTWKQDRFGNLIEFSYVEPKDGVTGSNEANSITLTIDKDQDKNVRVWTPEEWRIETTGGEFIKGGENPLGYVPVVEYASVESEDFLPASEFFQISKMNFRLFNLLSEIQEIESNQMYPVLTIPSNNNKDYALGSQNGLMFDPEAPRPDYIAPPSDPIKTLMANAEIMVRNIHTMAGLTYTQSVSNLSAESKKWDFEKTESMLKAFSQRSQSAEEAIVFIFEDWMDINTNYQVDYSQEFGVASLTDELERAVESLQLPLGANAAAEVTKKYIMKEFAFADDKTKEILEESIDNEAQDNNDQEATEQDLGTDEE